jgi:hypothetical protein
MVPHSYSSLEVHQLFGDKRAQKSSCDKMVNSEATEQQAIYVLFSQNLQHLMMELPKRKPMSMHFTPPGKSNRCVRLKNWENCNSLIPPILLAFTYSR